MQLGLRKWGYDEVSDIFKTECGRIEAHRALNNVKNILYSQIRLTGANVFRMLLSLRVHFGAEADIFADT